MNKMKMAAIMHEIMWKSKGFHKKYVISYTLETNYIWIYWAFFPFYRSSIRELANLPGGPILLLLPHLEIQDGRQEGHQKAKIY